MLDLGRPCTFTLDLDEEEKYMHIYWWQLNIKALLFYIDLSLKMISSLNRKRIVFTFFFESENQPIHLF